MRDFMNGNLCAQIFSFFPWFQKMLGFFVGAILLCLFSTIQKMLIGAPLVLKGYLVPVLFGGACGMMLAIWQSRLKDANIALQLAHENLEKTVKMRTFELEKALSEIQTLEGLLPICSCCHKIRNEEGEWTKIESYLKIHTNADFTHGICPECAEKNYPDICIYDDDYDEG